MPSWINIPKSSIETTESYNSFEMEAGMVSKLNERQRRAFNLVRTQLEDDISRQLLLIITGKAGSGKSFLIDRLRNLLQSRCIICAMFGIAAYNVNGKTLHYLLKLPIKGKRNADLEGSALTELQENFKEITHVIIDEFSVISQKTLAWINRRLKQAKGKFDVPFGGVNVILVGDLGQLPPVKGYALFNDNLNCELELEGFFIYNQFLTVVELTANQRTTGLDEVQCKFRTMLENIRNGKVTIDDWRFLLTRSVSEKLKAELPSAVKLSHSNKDVAENNFQALNSLGNPIAIIHALHSNKQAKNAQAMTWVGLIQNYLYLTMLESCYCVIFGQMLAFVMVQWVQSCLLFTK